MSVVDDACVDEAAEKGDAVLVFRFSGLRDGILGMPIRIMYKNLGGLDAMERES